MRLVPAHARALSAVLFLAACQITFGQEIDGASTEDVFQRIRSAQLKYRLETMNGACPGTRSLFACKTENSIEEARLTRLLESRATDGDAVASFYAGLIASELGEQLTKSQLSQMGDEAYEKALRHFKKACEGKVYGGCWNVASMYENGQGDVRSSLAASEWYYRAGVGYLALGQRERALAALEHIRLADADNPLGKKLSNLLRKGSPAK